MTKPEAVAFINGLSATLVQAPVVNVAIDSVKWEEFKTSMLAFLAEPGVDPKYKAALEAANIKIDEANVIVDTALA
jgi:hypothetical protein